VIEDYRRSVLPNGIRVVTERMPHVRSVAVGVWVETGSRYETAGRDGVSHMIEHLVFKGTATRSAEDIAKTMDSVGGQMDAFTTKEHTCFYVQVLDERSNQIDMRPMVREQVRVTRLLREATLDVAPFVALRRQVLVRDYARDLGMIAGDTSKLRDCLNQLLLNAIKFTPDGGRITLAARHIDDGAVEIQVRDSGIGIDEATCHRVFDPFFTTFDVSRHSSGTFEFDRRGLGLGLAVVKVFVEMHGGRVSVESEVGVGSTFTMVLPQAPVE